MKNIDWDNLRHFLEVVRAGTVTRAARSLGVNHTTVSRRIRALERDLEATLFDRSGGTWALTPAGEKILGSAGRMAESAGTVRLQAAADNKDISGLLRITANDIVVQRLLLPDIKSFLDLYPDIQVELISGDEQLNLSTREADVAFRGTASPPPNVLGKHICHVAFGIYGREQLLDTHLQGIPVPTITWIGDGVTRPVWIERGFSRTPSIVRVNSVTVMLEAVRLGMGVAQIACIWGDTDPLLRKIPGAVAEPGWDLWLLSHVDLRVTARVRIFRDYMLEKLLAKKDLLEGRGASPAN